MFTSKDSLILPDGICYLSPGTECLINIWPNKVRVKSAN